MLRDEVELYTKLTDRDGWKTPINVIGAYLDGYERGWHEQLWTPVDEKLPDVDGDYWVTDTANRVATYVFDSNGNSAEYWKRCAIAWMPKQISRPDPYQGKEKFFATVLEYAEQNERHSIADIVPHCVWVTYRIAERIRGHTARVIRKARTNVKTLILTRLMRMTLKSGTNRGGLENGSLKDRWS